MTTTPSPADRWQRGDAYERYMGRWSRQVAPRFVRGLAVPQARRMAWLRALYDAVLPRLGDIHAHLKTHPWPNLPPAEQSLLNLALALMEVALAVESHGQPTVPFGFDHTRFRVWF